MMVVVVVVVVIADDSTDNSGDGDTFISTFSLLSSFFYKRMKM